MKSENIQANNCEPWVSEYSLRSGTLSLDNIDCFSIDEEPKECGSWSNECREASQRRKHGWHIWKLPWKWQPETRLNFAYLCCKIDKYLTRMLMDCVVPMRMRYCSWSIIPEKISLLQFGGNFPFPINTLPNLLLAARVENINIRMR